MTEAALAATLRAAARRAMVRHVLQAVAIGSAAIAVLIVTGMRGAGLTAIVSAAAATAVVSIARRRGARTPRALTAALEARFPDLQNVVVTAEELLRHRDRSPEWIRARVFADADAALRRVDVRALWPVNRLTVGAAAALLAAVGALLLTPPRLARADLPPTAAGPATEREIVVQLTPPAYTGKPALTVRNPDRLEAIEGTVARVTVQDGKAVRIRLGARPLPLSRDGLRATAERTLTESGYLAVELDAPGDAPPHLIAVTVVPDRRPVVRIDQPARDLLLPDAGGSVAIAGSVSDDLGLSALTLHYTKVSGAGEQIDFVEGELPLQISRNTDLEWRGRGSIALPALRLEPGDSLVYRMVARDRRAGETGSSSSDTFFVEIAGPGQVPLEGVALPPEQERSALSQQMVVIKIRRLRERERTLTPAALGEQAAAIAAEQRSVRANFVFLMGGEVEDEEEEAEHSHEIQEGRLENTSRREMSRAVSHMTAAEQGLTARDTSAALRAATLAVEALQRAFSRNRYILRTLASRTKLDPSRRLSGEREGVDSRDRKLAPATGDPEARRARELLQRFLTVMAARSPAGASHRAAELSEIAEATLAVNPADRRWREASEVVVRLRDLIASRVDRSRTADLTGDAVRRLTALGTRNIPTLRSRAREAERIEGAWVAEGRRQ